jgi:hypothetical protein
MMEQMSGRSPREILDALTGEILSAAGADLGAIRLRSGEGRPRLTEPWFC